MKLLSLQSLSQLSASEFCYFIVVKIVSCISFNHVARSSRLDLKIHAHLSWFFCVHFSTLIIDCNFIYKSIFLISAAWETGTWQSNICTNYIRICHVHQAVTLACHLSLVSCTTLIACVCLCSELFMWIHINICRIINPVYEYNILVHYSSRFN